ncbi:hypothetical protein Adt_48699 [Abeliophyllum distichum]|uniref:Uncharacterized protein n=1 Tax=Abeliophyllum distichum TaxID=126358 RepID=A0ABD1NQB0_9LAMI
MGKAQPPEFNTPMINCSCLSPTTEETRSWQLNNKSTRGLILDTRTALGRSLQTCSIRNKPRSCASHTGTRDSAIAPVPFKGTSLAHTPLPLGLSNRSCSIQRNKLRSCAPPTGTRQSLLFHSKEQASLMRLSNWDSAIALVPFKGTSLAHAPFTLGLGNRSCSIQRNKPSSSASSTGTRQSLLFHSKEQASLMRPSHWDSAIALVPFKGTSLAHAPSHWDSTIVLVPFKGTSLVYAPSHWDSTIALVPFKGTSLAHALLPLGLGNRSCSFQRNKPSSSASPTGTRQSLLFHSKEQASLMRPSHWDSATAPVPFKGTSLADAPLPLGLDNRSCSIQRNKPRSCAPPTGTRQSLLFHIKEQASLMRRSHWDSAIALVPFKGTSLAHAPLPLGLGNRSCSIQRNKPRSCAPPTGTRQPLLFHSKEQALLMRPSHWDSATAPVPFKGTSLAHAPLPLGLGNCFCSIQRNKPRSCAAPTVTRQSLLFHSKEQASLMRPSHWDSAIALVPFKGTGLAHAPLPLGLGNRSCSIQRNKPRSCAAPTGTWQSLLFHSKEQASLMRRSHWDSAIALVPFKGTSLAHAPLPLGLGNRSCSIQRNKPRSCAPPTGTRQSLLFHSKEQVSLMRSSHWDSAIALVPFKGTSLAQAPLPLGLGNRSCSIQRNKPRSCAPPTGTRQPLLFHSKEQALLMRPSHWDSAIAFVPFKGTSLAHAPLPLLLGNRSCSIQRNKPRSCAPPTGTRQSLLFHSKEQVSLMRLFHWDSAIALVPFKGTSLAHAPLPLGLGNRSCSIQRNKPRSCAAPTGTRQSLLFHSKEQASLMRPSHWDSAIALVPFNGTSLAHAPLPLGLGN